MTFSISLPKKIGSSVRAKTTRSIPGYFKTVSGDGLVNRSMTKVVNNPSVNAVEFEELVELVELPLML